MPYSLEEAMTLTPSESKEETLQVKKGLSFDEAMGLGSPKAEEDPDFFSRSFQSFTSGMARFNSGVVRAIPTVPYTLAATPQNIVAELTGWNVGAKTPDWMLDNPLTRYFDDASKSYSYTNKKYSGKDLMSLVDEGDYSSAGDFIFQSAIENTPNTLAILAASLSGIPAGATLGVAGSIQGAESFKEARDKNLSQLESTAVGVLNGSFEAIFEKMGTLGLVEKWGQRIAKDLGKKNAEAVIYSTFKKIFAPIFGEMNEEGWTQLTQDFTNKVYGVEDIPWKDFPGRAVQAAAIASVSGVATTGAAQLRALQLRNSTPEEIDNKRADAIVQAIEARKTGSEVTAQPQADTIINNTPSLVETPLKPEAIPSEEVKPSEVIEPEGTQISEPLQLEELKKQTISEFKIGEKEAESIRNEDLVIEGKPRREIIDRARALRDVENIQFEADKETIGGIVNNAGRFHIEKGSEIYEELKSADIPKEFLIKKYISPGVKSNTFDEFAQQFRDSNPDYKDASSSEIIDYLSGLSSKRKTIGEFISQAKRDILGELQGQTFERKQKGIKKDIRKLTGQVREKPEPVLVDPEQEFLEKLAAEERASKEGFRAGKEVGQQQVKSAKEILDRRRRFIRLIQNEHGLSDRDLKRIGGKDIRLMNNYEFKQYLDEIDSKAVVVQERREAKIRLLSTLHEKEFVKETNLRKALKLPPVEKMSTDQLNQFNDALEGYQKGDEFLTVRALETLDDTELAGAKTSREVREILAKRSGVSIEEIEKSKFSPLDRIKYDLVLSESNPLYKYVVEMLNKAKFQYQQKYLNFSRTLDDLVKKSRESRERTVIEKAIPTDRIIAEFLESSVGDKVKLAEKMTGDELNLAGFLDSTLRLERDNLLRNETLKKFIENYFPHIRRSFLETYKDQGLVVALKEMIASSELEEDNFKILSDNLQDILPYEKFFPFAMKRSGIVTPTKNVARAAKAYMQSIYLKEAFDSIVPAIQAYTYSVAPKGTTPKGLELDKRLMKFVREYVNNKKGRKFTYGGTIPQGGVVDNTIRMIRSFITFLDLGINVGVNLATPFGERYATFINLGSNKYIVGEKRLKTKKGKEIINANRDFVGISIWEELADTAKNIGSKFHQGIFGLMHQATVNANSVHLLGSLTEEEFNSGQISDERKSDLLLEMQKYRHIPGTSSVIGSTSLFGIYTQYKTWAIPFAVQTVRNISKLTKMLQSNSGEQITRTKEFQELARITMSSILFYGAVKLLIPDDDESFVGNLYRRIMSDLLSAVGSLNPLIWLGVPRMVKYFSDIGKALDALIKLEGYKTKSGLKGVDQLIKANTPRAIKQFKGKETGNSNNSIPSEFNFQ